MGRSQIFLAVSEGSPEPTGNEAASGVALNSSPVRQKRWGIGIGDPELGTADEPAPGSSKFQNIRLSCSCKYSIKASCFITFAAIFELVGNTYSLAYGVSYIMGAGTFFDQKDANLSQLQQAEAYEEKLNRVTFLRKNGAGLVVLLSTCFIGQVVSVLMPIGVFWKSWKALRTSMALLFAICLAQTILASIYLSTSVIIASAVVIPFRIYEIYLIHSYIRYYKNKKKRALCYKAGVGLYSPSDSQAPLGVSSVQSVANNLDRPQNQSGVMLDLNDGDINDGTNSVIGMDVERNGEELASKRGRKKSKKGGRGVTNSISRWRRRARKGHVKAEELRDMELK